MDLWEFLFKLNGHVFFSPNLLLQNKDGKSPLHVAAMYGRFTGSQILIQNGKINNKIQKHL